MKDEHIVSDNVRFVNVKGRSILVIDFPSTDDQEEMLDVVDCARRTIRAMPENSVLVLSRFGEYKTHITKEVLNDFKEYLSGNKPYVVKSAVLGFSGIKKTVFNAVLVMANRRVKLFGNEEDAIKFLLDS